MHRAKRYLVRSKHLLVCRKLYVDLDVEGCVGVK